MTGFLAQLGGKVAEKWLSLLVLPGLLLLGTATAGWVLRQGRWHDLGYLAGRLNQVAHEPAAHSVGVVVLVIVAVTVGAAGLGVVVQGGAEVVTRLWTGTWPFPVHRIGTLLTASRQRRWRRAKDRYDEALRQKYRQQRAAANAAAQVISAPDTSLLKSAMNRICLVEPQRPTWMGDRMLAVESRVREHYDLDLASCWSRLWLILPDAARADLRSASEDVSSAARLACWGFLYLLVGIWWWPSAVLGVVAIAASWRRARTDIDVVAQLVEASVDLHGRDLAQALGIDCPGCLTPAVGLQITKMARKGA